MIAPPGPLSAGPASGSTASGGPPSDSAASASAADLTALFAEARRRRRRRRITAAAVSLAVAGSVMIGLTSGGGHHDPAPRTAASPRRAVITKPDLRRFTLPAAHVAWVDYNGALHIGDVATGTQHVVATVRSDAGDWFVAAAGHVYWPDFSKNSGPIRGYDLATGKVQRIGRGESVFASPGSRRLYIMRSATRLIEVHPGRPAARRAFTVPAGWRLSCCQAGGTAAGGIIVYSAGGRSGSPADARIAIWSPRDGSIRPLGAGYVVDDIYTPHGARHSLIAWQSASCAAGNCPVRITNTATLATVTVRSPLRHGFTEGDGTFSPDGTELAVFVRRASIRSNWPNHSELALINTTTGTLRLVRAAKLITQEDAGWVLWLPGGHRLLAGALLYSYAVDAKTLAVRPFFFFPGNEHDIMTTPDLNFSAVLIPGRYARQAQRGSR
jgi:hypothetical protein